MFLKFFSLSFKGLAIKIDNYRQTNGKKEVDVKNFLEDFFLEIGFISILGMIYYFYQKKKIVHYEENKDLFIMGLILESCLQEKQDRPEPELDTLIEALDDFLNQKISSPPIVMLEHFTSTNNCSDNLREIIQNAFKEMELSGKK